MASAVNRVLAAGDLRALLEAGPTERVAILDARSSPRALAETLAAFANARGGLIILDATPGDLGETEGPGQQALARLDAARLMLEPPLIASLPEMVEGEGRFFCAVQVPPGLPHVYGLRGQYFVRDGRHNRPLQAFELRRLLIDRSETGFEAQVLPGAAPADLDADRVAAYAERLGSGIAPAPNVQPKEALLHSRGCLTGAADGPHPTVAGLLLFGRDPQRWLRSATLTCVRYPGASMGDEFVREDIGGPLPDQVRRAEVFVTGNMRQGMRISGLVRQEMPEYPVPVVREAIVNAIAHRDYSIRGDNIRIMMFSDRLEVSSPGRLPGHVTLDNLVEERFSRNEAIVQVLADMGFIERLGYGIDRMISVCQAEGLPRPQFAETAGGFKVVVYGHGPELVGAAPPASLWSHLHLNPRQEQALHFVQQNRRITNSDYQTLCPDASPETLRRDFADLVDRGILLKIGEKRATYYVLK